MEAEPESFSIRGVIRDIILNTSDLAARNLFSAGLVAPLGAKNA